MRYLPFSFARGPVLAWLAQAVCEDPGRRRVCAFCGGRVPLRPEIPEQSWRCPHCWRRQRFAAGPEPLRELSPEALNALRRTTGWVRRWPGTW